MPDRWKQRYKDRVQAAARKYRLVVPCVDVVVDIGLW